MFISAPKGIWIIISSFKRCSYFMVLLILFYQFRVFFSWTEQYISKALDLYVPVMMPGGFKHKLNCNLDYGRLWLLSYLVFAYSISKWHTTGSACSLLNLLWQKRSSQSICILTWYILSRAVFNFWSLSNSCSNLKT